MSCSAWAICLKLGGDSVAQPAVLSQLSMVAVNNSSGKDETVSSLSRQFYILHTYIGVW